MTSKTQSSRRVRRPLIKAAKGMVAMTFLGGCRLYTWWPTDDGSGGYGGGGSGGGGGGADGSTSSGSSGTAGEGGTGGTGGSEPTCAMGCAEAVTDYSALCDSAPATSQAILNDFVDCACVRLSTDMLPGCADATVCGDNLCLGTGPSMECSNCLQMGACMNEFEACANDL